MNGPLTADNAKGYNDWWELNYHEYPQDFNGYCKFLETANNYLTNDDLLSMRGSVIFNNNWTHDELLRRGIDPTQKGAEE